MSVDSVLDDRYALWIRALDAWGYEIEEHPRPAPANGILIRARRPDTYGDPSVVIDIAETWAQGGDPGRLRLTNRGNFLVAASWHAQFPAPGSVGAERLDVDRTKPGELVVHRHPLGAPNDVREAAQWQRPETWVRRIDRLIFDYDVDEKD